MKHLRHFALFLKFVTLNCLLANSQQRQLVQIGDTISRINFNHVLNFNSHEIQLGGKGSKYIILDFGTTTCQPCAKILPILDSAQAEHPKELQVFFITFEDQQKVEQFLSKLKRQFSIALIYADSSLSKTFKHKYFPHEIWINPHGVVTAITNHEYVTRDNINLFVSGGSQKKWPVKWDFDYNYTSPIWKIDTSDFDSGLIPNQKNHSGFTSSIEGVAHRSNGKGMIFDSTRALFRKYFINYSIFEMYLRAWNRFDDEFPPSKIVLNLKDTSSIYYFPKYGPRAEWDLAHSFCYELCSSRDLPKEQITNKIVSDLNCFFNLIGRPEKIPAKCWVISQKGKPPVNQNTNQNRISLGKIIYELNNTWGHIPVINETGLSSQKLYDVWISSMTVPKTFDEFKRMANSIGLELKEGNREVEMFIISDGDIKSMGSNEISATH